jgi:hypothetical protein
MNELTNNAELLYNLLQIPFEDMTDYDRDKLMYLYRNERVCKVVSDRIDRELSNA